MYGNGYAPQTRQFAPGAGISPLGAGLLGAGIGYLGGTMMGPGGFGGFGAPAALVHGAPAHGAWGHPGMHGGFGAPVAPGGFGHPVGAPGFGHPGVRPRPFTPFFW